MSDPFTWTIRLGRWAGVQVSVHLIFALFVLGKLLNATIFDTKHEVPLAETSAWLALLVVALILHELGHIAAASRLGQPIEDITLWPLGNLQGPQPVPISRSNEMFLIALWGPLMNLAAAMFCGIALAFAESEMVLNPFGREGTGSGAPSLDSGGVATAFTLLWWVGWFGYINWVLFLANLIPALPMDGGRVLRALLAGPTFGTSKDGLIAPWTARTFAIILGGVGVYRLVFLGHEGGITLICLAVLIEWMFRIEARLLEEGGFYEEGLFGYDFSEGYTSLEGSSPKVRPYRESALARWRRRRSELRRQRRETQEAAEESRMDEILVKIHTQGRASLTDEENRFLIRVSARFKKKARADD
jgi:stage IV sporulation protein FB